MRSKILFAAMTGLLALPASAHEPNGDAEIVHRPQAAPSVPSAAAPCGDAEFLRELEGIRAELKDAPARLDGAPAKAPSAAQKREDGLNATLNAMRDGISVGGTVLAFMEKEGVKKGSRNVAVSFQTQATASMLSVGSPNKVLLSDALPAAPRVLAPYIAHEVSALMYADMPECAEKEYMRRSLETRLWLELGGERRKLPVVETSDGGYTDNGLSVRFKSWLNGYQDPEGGAASMGAAAGIPTISDLKLKALDAKEKAALAKAAAAFKAFSDDELEWCKLNKATTDL